MNVAKLQQKRIKALQDTGKPAKRPDGGEYQLTLEEYVAVWPTPTGGGAEQLSNTLVTTPTADDTGHRKKPYSQGGEPLSYQVGGQLNPTWVEWLMGFPVGWTDLRDLETL